LVRIWGVAPYPIHLRRTARILARTSPSIKRSELDDTMETVFAGKEGIPLYHVKHL
jgi:hypothetical protein